MIGTEQPGTVWFERQLPYLGGARLALDLDSHAVEHLRRVGIHSQRVPLGYHHSWDHWGGDATRPRPRDVVFLGAVNHRRERFLAEAASRLWDRRFELRLFEVNKPKHAEDAGFLAGADKWSWLAGTKLLLNVHRGSAPYFEWLRALEAMVNGCVLVTEPSDDPAPLVPGEHFVQAPLHLLSEYAIGLLADPHRVAAIADAAYQFLRTERRMVDLLRPVVEEIESLPSVGAHRGPPIVAPSAAPAAPPEPAIEEEHRRRLDALECRPAHVDERDQTVEKTPGWEGWDADVSVVVSLFECRHGVEDAVESALGSLETTVEVIVVDDHSRDGSGDTVRRRMKEDQRAPLALVTKSAPRGAAASDARGLRCPGLLSSSSSTPKKPCTPTAWPSCGMSWPRAPSPSPTASSSASGTSPGSRTTCRGTSIGWAPATTPRAPPSFAAPALEQLGEPEESPVTDSGPEEYDLWLRLATEGHQGTLLPEVVVRRQSGPLNRLSRSEIHGREQRRGADRAGG